MIGHLKMPTTSQYDSLFYTAEVPKLFHSMTPLSIHNMLNVPNLLMTF